MSDETKATPDLSRELSDAIEVLGFGKDTLYEMGSLFRAISKESDQYSHVRRLASIGEYLAEDWANSLDCKRGDLVEIAGAKGVRT